MTSIILQNKCTLLRNLLEVPAVEVGKKHGKYFVVITGNTGDSLSYHGTFNDPREVRSFLDQQIKLHSWPVGAR